jgi:hypothetical protein
LNDLVETLQELGAIPLLKRRWPAAHRALLPQLSQEIAHRQRRPDRVGVVLTPSWIEDLRTHLQAAMSEWDVPGDHNIVLTNVFDDPVIRGIKRLANDDKLEVILIRQTHPRIGNEDDVQTIAPGDTVDLVFHRATIGVDIDV